MIRFTATASLAVLAAAAQGIACTAVDIVARDKTVIAGRTMEWAFDMKWTLKSVPKGTALTLSAPAALGLPTKEIATTHAFVGVSADIIPGGAILEGQNDAGLGLSGNFLPEFTQYQDMSKEDASYVSILGAHRTNYLTLDLDKLFARTKAASVAISALPYPAEVDGTDALME